MTKHSIYILAFTVLTLSTQNVIAQTETGGANFTGTLIDADSSKPVKDGYVSLARGDSLIGFATSGKNGRFGISGLPSGKYAVSVNALFFKDFTDTLTISGKAKDVTYALNREVKSITLQDVTVTADRSHIIGRTANGQRFYLSEKAKKLHNPFQALQEIPLLISDPSSSSVKTLDGKTPLILIDGNRVNSGIAPINPADIESIEVINTVSARYLQEGIGGIVNIKLKRKSAPYVWLEAATRHDLPADHGFGVFYFEIGNRKYSLYGRTVYDYTYHDDTEADVARQNTTYTQNFTQAARTDKHSRPGELLFKWSLTPKDYFAAHGYADISRDKTHGEGKGLFTQAEDEAYAFSTGGNDKSLIATTSLCCKHSFSSGNNLEVRLAYNFNRDNYSETRTEQYGGNTTGRETLFKSRRHSGSLMIDYARDFKNGTSIAFGSHTSLKRDNIANRAALPSPAFVHEELNQYVYGDIGGKTRNVYYMLSAGVEGIWLKAGNAGNHYFRPRGSLSVTWTPDGHNSLQLSYTLTNDAPAVANLNPYNISTDSLVVETGNPYLMPQTMHYAGLAYTFNTGGLYLTPSVYYKRITDMIEQYGFTENGVYTNTYANLWHFSQAMAGASASYRFTWGRVYAGGGWYANRFKGRKPRNMAYASLGFNARAGKFSFYGTVDYNSMDAGANSCTRYYRPSTAEIQANYNFTPDFYIALCLQHFTGRLDTKTVTKDGSFRQATLTRHTDRCLRPWILVRYTFHKNDNKKIKLGKVLRSLEDGISIQRK